MEDSKLNPRETVNNLNEIGNSVYESAITALQLPELISRALLSESLSKVGLDPNGITIELLCTLMPQVEESLRQCLPQSEATPAMARLRHLVMDWEHAPEGARTARFSEEDASEKSDVDIEWK